MGGIDHIGRAGAGDRELRISRPGTPCYATSLHFSRPQKPPPFCDQMYKRLLFSTFLRSLQREQGKSLHFVRERKRLLYIGRSQSRFNSTNLVELVGITQRTLRYKVLKFC